MAPDSLRTWLESQTPDGLAAMLEQTRAARAGAAPQDLAELAERLCNPHLVSRQLQTAPTPTVQIVEAISALGGAPTLARLSEALGEPFDSGLSADLTEWLNDVFVSVLAWPVGERIMLNPALDRVLEAPYALARPARAVVQHLTVDVLRRTLKTAGRPAPQRKAEMIDAVLDVFADRGAIQIMAARAPAPVLGRLMDLVAKRLADVSAGLPPGDEEFGIAYGVSRADWQANREMHTWALQNGLAFGFDWDYGATAEFPTEVYLALAPPDFRLPFTPQCPIPTRVPVTAAQVERASAAAITEFLGTTMALLEAARPGLAVLKNGGIGSRELTRFAKQVGTDVATVRMVLHLAMALNLLDVDQRGLHPNEAFEGWRRQAPARRATDLLQKWLMQTIAPTIERDEAGKYLPLFNEDTSPSDLPLGLAIGASLRDERELGAIDPQQLLDAISWSSPFAYIPTGSTAATWAEGHKIGVYADGALAPFAHPLVAGDEAGAVAMLAEILPDEQSQVLFGSDLTVMIPGNAAPDAVDLLDIVAVREGHGVVGSWRFTEASVRSALDNGYRADDLLTGLAALSEKPLPQALEYVVRDVARKHGHLGVRDAAAVITSDDEALLAEVVAARALRTLELALVTPTVAVASRPGAEVLAGLRSAGYLPVEVDRGGARVVEVQKLPAAGSTGDDGGDEFDREMAEFIARTQAELRAGGLPLTPEALAQRAESDEDIARRLLGGDS